MMLNTKKRVACYEVRGNPYPYPDVRWVIYPPYWQHTPKMRHYLTLLGTGYSHHSGHKYTNKGPNA